MMNNLYPALTQSKLEFEIQQDDQSTTQQYQEFETISISNYQNYVIQAQMKDPKTNQKNWSKAEFDGFNLPAQGFSKSYCLKWVSWGCDNIKEHPNKKHYAEHELKTCKVASCPKCFESWINRQANRSTRRFSKFVENKQYSFRHVILSPPPEKAKNMNYNQLKSYLSFALRAANIKTAGVVFHPFRFMDSKKRHPYVSPHFHLIVYGKITNTTEFNNKTGWLIKNKGDLDSDIDIFNCVRYLLSHAGIRGRTHAIRYLGDISYRKLKVEKEIVKRECPYCNLPLRIFRIVFSQKHTPPPIDHKGLWESRCFEAIDPHDPEAKIPFYRTPEENEVTTQPYLEDMHYSFEELLRVSLALPEISHRYWELSMLDRVTARKLSKITEFV